MKLTKLPNGSLLARIPKIYCDEANISENDVVLILAKKNQIIIKKIEKEMKDDEEN